VKKKGKMIEGEKKRWARDYRRKYMGHSIKNGGV